MGWPCCIVQVPTLWIGLSVTPPTTWQTVAYWNDGEELKYTNWGQGQPVGWGGNCASVTSNIA